MEVKVLGAGCCANGRNTVAMIEDVARAKGVAINLQQVEDLKDIVSYGVMSTPGVVVDGKVVHAGGVPTRDKIEQWLAGSTTSGAAQPGGCCGGGTRKSCCG
jgi:predicted thioredoxin/glutaredoxin